VRHLDEGTLRRLLDEPFAVPTADRLHVECCPTCKARLETVAADARAVSSLFGGATLRVGNASALTSFRSAHPEKPAGHVRKNLRLSHRPGVPAWCAARWLRLPGALGLVVLVVLGCALTPAGSFTHDLLTAFQPKSYRVVPVPADELQGLPNLSDFGVMSNPPNTGRRSAATASAAAALAGMHVATPASIPSGVPRNVTYDVMSPTWASFEFSASIARASVARTGHQLPPMPAQLDHSILRLSVGPIVLTRYGAPTRGNFTVPSLVVVQAPEPVLTSSGAPVALIEQYLLGLPSVSAQLRQQIEAIGDPSETLPIPIPIDSMTADPVTIQGVQGLAIGDSTSLGSGVLWRKNGMVYAVAGAMSEDKVLSAAESLH
jgi:hypothetical protein